MGDSDDDFVMERIRKNERFRRLEEERRQERLRKACAPATSTTVPVLLETTTTSATATMTRSIDNNDDDVKETSKLRDAPPKNNASGATRSNSEIRQPSSKQQKGVSFLESNYPLPKGISSGYIHSRTAWSSPSSSVTMSQPTPPETKQYKVQPLLLLSVFLLVLLTFDCNSSG